MDLTDSYPIVTDQMTKSELRVILRELEGVLRQKILGDIVELGCYEGTTALFVTRLLMQHGSDRTVHVYDSFAGLPEKGSRDLSPAGEQFKAGELHASKRTLVQHFKKANLQLPVIHSGWFSDLRPSDMPSQIAFAFLDGDFYDSIKDSLKVVWPRLVPGSVVVVDDYQNAALPGAARAVDEWTAGHPAHLRVEASLALLRPALT